MKRLTIGASNLYTVFLSRSYKARILFFSFNINIHKEPIKKKEVLY